MQIPVMLGCVNRRNSKEIQKKVWRAYEKTHLTLTIIAIDVLMLIPLFQDKRLYKWYKKYNIQYIGKYVWDQAPYTQLIQLSAGSYINKYTYILLYRAITFTVEL